MNARILILILVTVPTLLSAQLRLDSLLSRIDDHPRVRAAAAAIDMQHGRKLQALSPPAPELTFHEEEIPNSGTFGQGALREWHISQGFDLPLLIGARSWQYSHLERAAELRMQSVKMEVRAELIRAYAQWYTRQKQLDIQRENVRLSEDFAVKAQLRYETGETSSLEAARARATAASARMALANSSTAVEAAALALYEAAGGRGDVRNSHSLSSAPETLRPVDMNALSTRMTATPGNEHGASSSHPVQQQLREEREAMRSNASWRWMEFLPRFDATWFRQEFADIGQHWGAELTASLPLWFLFDTRGSIEEHQAASRMAEEDYTIATMQFAARREQSKVRLRSSAENYLSYEDGLLAEASIISETAKLGYESGEIGYMEYLAAQQTANDINLGYYDALAELYGALAEYELYSNEQILE